MIGLSASQKVQNMQAVEQLAEIQRRHIGLMQNTLKLWQNVLADGASIANDNRDKVNRKPPPPPEAEEEPEASDLLECKTCDLT